MVVAQWRVHHESTVVQYLRDIVLERYKVALVVELIILAVVLQSTCLLVISEYSGFSGFRGYKLLLVLCGCVSVGLWCGPDCAARWR